MTQVKAVLVMVDELRAPGRAEPPLQAWQAVAQLADQGCAVWWVGKDLQGLPGTRVHQAGDWATAAAGVATRTAAGSAGTSMVLVVGADPRGGLARAAAAGWSSVLINPIDDPIQLDGAPLEAADFTLPSLAEVPGLVHRLERDPADYEGTE